MGYDSKLAKVWTCTVYPIDKDNYRTVEAVKLGGSVVKVLIQDYTEELIVLGESVEYEKVWPFNACLYDGLTVKTYLCDGRGNI